MRHCQHWRCQNEQSSQEAATKVGSNSSTYSTLCCSLSPFHFLSFSLSLCRFDIIKKLGQGTYGKVQLGMNKDTGQEVAIKTIKKSKIEAEADLVRIRREVQIMSSVQHPNIIHIYEGIYALYIFKYLLYFNISLYSI